MQKRPSPSTSDYPKSAKRNTAETTETTETTSTAEQSSSSIDSPTNISYTSSSCRTDRPRTPTNSPNIWRNGENRRSPNETSPSPTESDQDAEEIEPNTALLEQTFVDEFKTEWQLEEIADNAKQNNHIKQFLSDNIELYNSPFKLCVIRDFLATADCVRDMEREMCYMEWHRKQMDLYEFHQTTDLANLSLSTKPAIRQFYNMLNEKMLPWMRQVTGLPLTRISASCSMYNKGDYLLVHDDLLSDRQIAFVYYLSPWQHEWEESMGGALELFECDAQTAQPTYPIVKKIPPRNNQFVFFRVCQKSFHQVGEVTGMVYPRLTINGWFHGDTTVSAANAIRTDMDYLSGCAPYTSPSNEEVNLSEWINGSYLGKSTKSYIQRHIEERSEASLEAFLIRDFYDLLVNEFNENPSLSWELEGPANQRKFETLRLNTNATNPPKDLYKLFRSKSMFTLLHEYTELDFDGSDVKQPTCSIQICRFTQGCYTLLGDSSTFTENALDVILFFNVTNEVGKITYLSPNECGDGFDTSAMDTDATASSIDAANVSAASSGGDAFITMSEYLANKPLRPPGYNYCLDFESEEEPEPEPPSDPNRRIQFVKQVAHHTDEASDTDTDYLSCGEDGSSYDELTQENALLTIHPKNNSLNLVYRTNGQAKFVKYISKSSLKQDKYLYMLFATYKE